MNYIPLTLFLIPIVAIAGGFVMTGLAIYAQVRKREFEHRERLAMIERGIAPPAGVRLTPAGDALARGDRNDAETTADRLRRGGFIVMAVGVGIWFMMFMVSHDSSAALGVGGFLVILGAGMFLSSYFGPSAHEQGATPPDAKAGR